MNHPALSSLSGELERLAVSARTANAEALALREENAAIKAILSDKRVGRVAKNVYRWCREHYTDSPLSFKLLKIATETDEDESEVSRAMTALVASGYLREHERQDFGTRAFTLVRFGEIPNAA